MGKIILIRHGIVNINDNDKITAKEFGSWIQKYNSANIKDECNNKNEISKILNESNIIVCSSLKRSIQSIELFDKKASMTNTLFNEAQLPFRSFNFLTLKAKYWLTIFRILWFVGYSKNVESYNKSKIRAKAASSLLVELSKDNNNIVLIGHGIMNKLISKELKALSYKISKNSGNSNWSYLEFMV